MHILVLLFLVYSAETLRAQAAFTGTGSLEKFNTDLKIATVTVLKYSGNTGSPYNKEVSYYDKKGKQLKEIVYGGEALNVLSETDYQYDKMGRLIEIGKLGQGNKVVTTSCVYSENPPTTLKTEYMYFGVSKEPLKYISRYEYLGDEMLKRLEVTSTENTVIYDCIYNDKKQKVAEVYTNAQHDTTYRLDLYYNESGKLTRKVRYSGGHTKEEETLYILGSKGEVLMSISYDENGTEVSRKEYAYENGLMTSCKTFAKGFPVASIQKNYDEKGNLVYDSQLMEYYVYNEQNLPVEKGKVSKNGLRIPMEKYTYTFH